MATLSIRLLGGLTLECCSEDRTAHFSGRLRTLLALLLLQPDTPQSRQTLAYHLWPESTDKQARTNLRKLLLLLRAALGQGAASLDINAQTVCWRMDAECWLDTACFTQALAAATNAVPGETTRLLSQAVDLYRGDLLPDSYEEQILAARERLREQYINALERLCRLLEAEGRYAEGVSAARRLLQHDPVYEQGHWHLIRLQALMNDRAGALQSYHRCASLLRQELGVDPSAALEALYLQLLDHEMPASATPAAPPTASLPLIGRAAAWQQLVHLWQQARQGKAHFVLILGEAGIGKSRLAEEIMSWVDRHGELAAHARAYSSDNRSLTYAPIARLLRVPAIRSSLMRLPAYWLTEIARLLPEVVLERDDVPPPQPMQDDWQRHRLFAALTQALMPKRRGQLLVLDDLHWSDDETLTWLPHLLEHAKTEKLLMIGTARSEEIGDHTALQTMCETLRRHGQYGEIALGALPARDTAELARLAAGRVLAAPQTQWLVEATEGNPLFVIETARWLNDQSAAHAVDEETSAAANGTPGHSQSAAKTELLPQSVLAVIQARLSRLSKPAHALAEVAATIGRSFTLPVLAAASALDENELVDALDELWRRRIIREREGDAYDFSHDRIRDGATAGISALRRRMLHKRVAAAILATHPNAFDAISGQIGYHYDEANEREAAIEHYQRAAKHAQGQFAHADTLHYLDRILSLALPEEIDLRFETLLLRDHILEISATVAERERNLAHLRALIESERGENEVACRRHALVAERAVRLSNRTYQYAEAVALARQAVTYARSTTDIGLQALCHLTLGDALWSVADFEACIPHIEQAITLARQAQNDSVLADALQLRAQTHMFNGGKSTVIMSLLEESLDIYEKLDSAYGRCQILNKLGYIQFAQGSGRYENARDVLLEAVQLAREMSSDISEVRAQRNLAITYTCMGNYAAARLHLERSRELYSHTSQSGDDPALLNYWGYWYFSSGRLHDALHIQQRALAALTAANHGPWRVKALTSLAWIHLRLGKLDAAMSYAEQSLSQCQSMREMRQLAYNLIVRGILRTQLGQLAGARADFEEGRAILYAYDMANRSQEAEAGLAYVEMLEGNTAAAVERAHAVLTHLEAHPVDFSEDVCQLLYTCLQIFAGHATLYLPRLYTLIRLHLATRTATLDAETTTLFWQDTVHQTLRQAILA